MKVLKFSLWAPYGENNNRLFLAMPNPLVKDIISGKFLWTEVKLLLLVAKLTFGFNRETTYHLGLGNFVAETRLQKSQVSRGIQSLIKKGILFAHSHKSKDLKYGINLLRYGITMKDYYISEIDNEDLQYVTEDEQINKKDYHLYNLNCSKNYAILYVRKGYKIPVDSHKYIKRYTERYINKYN